MSSSENVLDLALLQEMLIDYPPADVEPSLKAEEADVGLRTPTIKAEEPDSSVKVKVPKQKRRQLHGRRRRHPHVPKKPLIMVYRLCPMCRKTLCKDRQRVRCSGESTFIRFKLCPSCVRENLVLNPVL